MTMMFCNECAIITCLEFDFRRLYLCEYLIRYFARAGRVVGRKTREITRKTASRRGGDGGSSFGGGGAYCQTERHEWRRNAHDVTIDGPDVPVARRFGNGDRHFGGHIDTGARHERSFRETDSSRAIVAGDLAGAYFEGNTDHFGRTQEAADVRVQVRKRIAGFGARIVVSVA